MGERQPSRTHLMAFRAGMSPSQAESVLKKCLSRAVVVKAGLSLYEVVEPIFRE